MNDRELLIFIHEKLEKYGENELTGFMHRLRHIIYSLPQSQYSPSLVVLNSLNDLRSRLRELEALKEVDLRDVSAGMKQVVIALRERIQEMERSWESVN